MTPQHMTREFLSEVCREAWRLCAARHGALPPGAGTPCGAALPLAQLVEAISLAGCDTVAGAAGPAEGAVQSGFCGCPPEELAALATEAAEVVMRRRRLRLVELWNDG